MMALKSLIIVWVLSTNIVFAIEPVVIVNQDNPLTSISLDDLAKIYLGKTNFWQNGSRIQPGLLSTDNVAIVDFLLKVCRKSPRRYNVHWMKRVFSGSGKRPEKLSSASQARRFVASKLGAIAVVDSFDKTKGVRQLVIEN